MATWKITGLFVEPSLGGHSNVVTDVSWACYGNQSLRGKISLGAPGIPFVEYPNLKESDVLGWVWAQVDKASTEEYVNADLVAPAVKFKPLPWE